MILPPLFAIHVAHALDALDVGAWTAVAPEHGHVAILREHDGAELWLDPRSHTGARVEVRSQWPRVASGHPYTPSKAERLRISVSTTRTPEAIAKDIARRLLPTYLPAYARACAYVAREARDHAQRLDDTRCLARAMGVEPRTTWVADRGSTRIYGDGMRAEVSVSSEEDGAALTHVTLTVGVEVEQALAIVRFVRESELVAIAADAGLRAVGAVGA